MSLSIPQTSGIYQIRCVSTGKVYVGSAVNLYRRWVVDHRPRLRGGRHPNVHLQRAWDKYGEAAFVFEVIELAHASLLVEYEQYHIDRVQACDDRHGFNVSPTAYSRLGVKASDETRQRISEAKRGVPLSEAIRQKFSELRKGRLYSDAARRARSVAQHNRPMDGISENMRRAQVEAESMWYVVTDPDGNEYPIKNLSRFCREHGLDRATAHRVAQGKARQHKGWRFRRLEDE